MIDNQIIDGNKVQRLLTKWNYKGFKILSIHIEDGYELIALGEDATGISTKAQNIDGALFELEGKIDDSFG